MGKLPPLNALRSFVTAARVGSFTKAGEALNVTQGAVSRQVKLLEASVGTALFVRSHQAIVLTPAGAELAASLEQAFDAIQHAVTRAAKFQQRQMLKVNLPPTFATRWLAPRLSDFRKQHPMVDLSITTDALQRPRQARHQDCLVMFSQQALPGSQSELLLQEEHVVVSSPQLWHDNAPPSLASSTLLHVLDGEQRLPIWEQWVSANRLTGIDTRPGLNFSTLDQAINAAIAGAGLVIVDQAMILRELRTGVLKRLNQQQIQGPFGYWFVDVASQPDRQTLVSVFHDWLLGQVRLFQADRSVP